MFDEDQDEENLNFNLRDIPYPQRGDKLFITDRGGSYVSCLNFQNDHLLLYISGYKDAGDTLVSTMMEHTVYLDTFLFPALFLYRHYLELSLKGDYSRW